MEAIQVVEDDRILLLQPKRTGAGKGGPCGLGGRRKFEARLSFFTTAVSHFGCRRGSKLKPETGFNSVLGNRENGGVLVAI